MNGEVVQRLAVGVELRNGEGRGELRIVERSAAGGIQVHGSGDGKIAGFDGLEAIELDVVGLELRLVATLFGIVGEHGGGEASGHGEVQVGVDDGAISVELHGDGLDGLSGDGGAEEIEVSVADGAES